jgi:hypothetical protein
MVDGDRRSLIEDEWEIRRCAYLYARAMDRNEPETIDRIFTEDAVLERPTKTWRGRAEIRTVPGWLHERCVNLTHQVHNHLADVDGDQATAETYGHSHLVQRGPSNNLYNFQQCLRYQDKLVRQEGVWRFVHRQIVYDWTATWTVGLGDEA